MKVAGVVLAAGASSRLGKPKQLVDLGGEYLLDRAVRMARSAGLAPVIVVLGCGAEEIRSRCHLDGTKVTINSSWQEGMASSVRAGVAAADADCVGLVLMTCDQPAAEAEHLRRLVDAGEGCKTVGSSYAGKIGVPAFLPASRFRDLLDLRGEEGARKLLISADALELPGGELDVDTAESLQAARLRFAPDMRGY